MAHSCPPPFLFCSATVPDLSQATQLTHLNLSYNDLSGTLPAWLSTLPQLAAANLSYNNLHGKMPNAWCEGKAVYDVRGNIGLYGGCGRMHEPHTHVHAAGACESCTP